MVTPLSDDHAYLLDSLLAGVAIYSQPNAHGEGDELRSLSPSDRARLYAMGVLARDGYPVDVVHRAYQENGGRLELADWLADVVATARTVAEANAARRARRRDTFDVTEVYRYVEDRLAELLAPLDHLAADAAVTFGTHLLTGEPPPAEIAPGLADAVRVLIDLHGGAYADVVNLGDGDALELLETSRRLKLAQEEAAKRLDAWCVAQVAAGRRPSELARLLGMSRQQLDKRLSRSDPRRTGEAL